MIDSEEATLDAKQAQKRQEIHHLPDPDSVFKFNKQLTDPTEFYGRVREWRTLKSNTIKVTPTSTSIVGPRRIGKTWLMSYLRLVATQEPNSHFRIGYLDATMPSCSTVSGFISKSLEELGNTIVGHANIDLDKLEQVVRDLRLRNTVPILCIDEFEGFGNRNEFDLNFYIGLRAIAQLGLVLVIASKNPLIDIVGDNGRTSGFFNVFEQLTLRPFNLDEAEKFANAKSIRAGFSDQERTFLLEYGRKESQQWPPLRLQLVGKMLLEDKNLAFTEGSHYYRPNDPDYWNEFESRLEEKYQGVVR